MIPVGTEGFRVLVDESKEIALLVWERAVGEEEFKRGCKRLAEYLNQHNLKKCLIDTYIPESLLAEGEVWEVGTLLQALHSYTQSELHLALVMSEEKYQHLIHHYSPSLATPSSHPINVHYFTEVDEAKEWLLNDTTAGFNSSLN
ncbi:hypothetical protein [Sabulibacter ruber]|uniref:hypothetical protein n=1 Tax=Sabulibacter ruber TaxID=2811901 RepID=UPI001A9659F4|nr:hypothetical protein [Sabulibacter ruber]